MPTDIVFSPKQYNKQCGWDSRTRATIIVTIILYLRPGGKVQEKRSRRAWTIRVRGQLKHGGCIGGPVIKSIHAYAENWSPTKYSDNKPSRDTRETVGYRNVFWLAAHWFYWAFLIGSGNVSLGGPRNRSINIGRLRPRTSRICFPSKIY